MKDLGIEQRILLKLIHVAQDRDQWQAVMNTVMNFGLQKILESSWLSEQLLAFEERLYSMELSDTFLRLVF